MIHQFIKKTFWIVGLPALLGIGAFVGFIYYINQQIHPPTLPQHVTTLYLGDSHIKVAVKDSLLPNSLNLADNSEHYYTTYYKLKALLEQQPSIKVVYLGLGVHNFSNNYDQVLYGNKATAVASNYFYSLPAAQQWQLYWWNKDHILPFSKKLIKKGLQLKNQQQAVYYQSQYSNNFVDMQSVPASIDKRIKKQFYKADSTLLAPSTTNREYLEKIIALCQDQQVELVGINMPLSPYYRAHIPVAYQKQLDDFLEQHPIQYYDLSTFGLPKTAYTPDGDHLTRVGVEFIMPVLQEHAAQL